MTARNHNPTGERDVPPVASRPDIACGPDDLPLFYPNDHDTPEQRRRSERKAKALCNSCPHQVDCLAWALESNQRWGIWGGLTSYTRERLRNALKPTTPSAS